MDQNKDKKLVAPTVILAIVIFLIIAWVVAFALIPVPVFRIIVVIAGAASIGALIAVYIQRVREIEKGEEDDISKY